MKRLHIITSLISVAATTLLWSCSGKFAEPALSQEVDMIRFTAKDSAFSTDTKASTGTPVVSSLTQFYVSATTGTVGSEMEKWTSVSFTGSTLYSGGKFWPHIDENYHFYAANGPMVFHNTSLTIAAVNTKDFVAAYLPTPTYKEQNLLTFDHIFARLGTVTLSAMPEYVITDVSIRITPKVSGTYNIRLGAGQTDGTGWTSTSTGVETAIADSCPGTHSNDVWLVPGDYVLTASWTASRDWNSTTGAYDYVRTFTDVPATVHMVAGKVNSITATLGGAATEIEFTTHIASWKADTENASFSSAYDGRQYLTFTSTSSNGIGIVNVNSNSPTLYYSYNLIDWSVWPSSAGVPQELAATSVKPLYVCGNNPGGLSGETSWTTFSVSGPGMVSCEGNVMCLLDYMTPPSVIPGDYCFNKLFQGCVKFTSAPALPSTTLRTGCYSQMFSGCSALVKAPALPATTLAPNCYSGMFSGCSALTTAPDLMATALANGSYAGMFYNCSSLNKVRALFLTDISSSDAYTSEWLSGVAATGIFVKHREARWTRSGANGIPSGWTSVPYGQD